MHLAKAAGSLYGLPHRETPWTAVHAFGLRLPTMAKVLAQRCYRGYLNRFSRLKAQQEMVWVCGSASRSLKSTTALSGLVLAQASRREQRFPLFCQCLPNDTISDRRQHTL